MELLKRYRNIYEVDVDGEQEPRGNSVVHFPAPQPPQQSDNASAALDLVAEAAAAIRSLEAQASEAVERAHHVADVLMQRLEAADARAQEAENKLQGAEAQIAQLSAAAREANNALSILQQRLSAKEAELVAAEKRAFDAETAIQSIIDAIRAQLPLAHHFAGE